MSSKAVLPHPLLIVLAVIGYAIGMASFVGSCNRREVAGLEQTAELHNFACFYGDHSMSTCESLRFICVVYRGYGIWCMPKIDKFDKRLDDAKE